MLVLTAVAVWLVWMITLGGTPPWYGSLDAARAAADDRLVVAVIHDPERLVAQETLRAIRKSTWEDWTLGNALVIADLHPQEAPAEWAVGETGFALRAMEPEGRLLAQRHGVLTPPEFRRFLEGVLEFQRERRVDGLLGPPDAGSVHAWLDDAHDFWRLGCQDQSRDAFLEVVGHPDADRRQVAEAHAWLALEEARRGQAERAAAHLRWLEEHDHAGNLEPVLLLARAHVAHVRRHDAEAERLLRQLIKDHGSCELIGQARGNLFQWVGSSAH